jgi:hypothetical protein
LAIPTGNDQKFDRFDHLSGQIDQKSSIVVVNPEVGPGTAASDLRRAGVIFQEANGWVESREDCDAALPNAESDRFLIAGTGSKSNLRSSASQPTGKDTRPCIP